MAVKMPLETYCVYRGNCESEAAVINQCSLGHLLDEPGLTLLLPISRRFLQQSDPKLLLCLLLLLLHRVLAMVYTLGMMPTCVIRAEGVTTTLGEGMDLW